MQPRGRIHTGAVHEGLHPMGGMPHCTGEMCEKEGAAELQTKHYKLTAVPIPMPCVGQRKELEELRLKLTLGRRRVEVQCF